MQWIQIFVDTVTEYQAAFIALGTVTIFLPALLNALKKLKVVADNQAMKVNVWLQAGAFVLFIGLRAYNDFFGGAIDIPMLDSALVGLAAVIGALTTFLVQIGASGLFYKVWRRIPNDTPVIGYLGFSHSQDF